MRRYRVQGYRDEYAGEGEARMRVCTVAANAPADLGALYDATFADERAALSAALEEQQRGGVPGDVHIAVTPIDMPDDRAEPDVPPDAG